MNPPCPCGSGRPYAACCGPCHQGRPATSAEALMRSRYSAYALGETAYLRATWHPDTCPAEIESEHAPKWIGLKIVRAEASGADCATVEFIARYRIGGRAGRLHEISRFIRQDERWLYVDGDLLEH